MKASRASRRSVFRSGTGEVRFIDKHLADPLRWKKPRRIFVNSMSDLFHEKLSNEEIAAVFGVMAAAPRHTFQVLTKRPERAIEWFTWAKNKALDVGSEADFFVQQRAWKILGDAFPLHPIKATIKSRPWPLPNVCIGVTAEDQKRADERIPFLLGIPAAIRFVSVEPQLEAVSLTRINLRPPSKDRIVDEDLFHDALRASSPAWPRIHWVICGGESGHRARPFDLGWARLLRDECAAADVAFFMKQMGADPIDGFAGCEVHFQDRAGADPTEWPHELRVQQFPQVSA